jgi:hypothetical protein
MLSTTTNFSSTIHIRDFVVNIVPDKTHSQSENSAYVEIHADVNIFSEDKFSEPTVIMEPIHTRIRAYLPSGERGTYVAEAFFYAHGRFHTIITKENKLEIIVQSLSLKRCDCFAISVPIQ